MKNDFAALVVLALLMTVSIVSAITPFQLTSTDGTYLYYTSNDCTYNTADMRNFESITVKKTVQDCAKACNNMPTCSFFQMYYSKVSNKYICAVSIGNPIGAIVATNPSTDGQYSCGLMKGRIVNQAAESQLIASVPSTNPPQTIQQTWDLTDEKDDTLKTVYSKVRCSFSSSDPLDYTSVTVPNLVDCSKQCRNYGKPDQTCTHFSVSPKGSAFECKLFKVPSAGIINLSYVSSPTQSACGFIRFRSPQSPALY